MKSALVCRAPCVNPARSKFRPARMRRTRCAARVQTSFRTMRTSLALVHFTKAHSHATGHVIRGIETLVGFVWAVLILCLSSPSSPAVETVYGAVMTDTVGKDSNANAITSSISMALSACPASSAQSVPTRVKYARSRGIGPEIQAASRVPIDCRSARNVHGRSRWSVVSDMCAIGSVRTDSSTTIQAAKYARSAPQALIKHMPV